MDFGVICVEISRKFSKNRHFWQKSIFIHGRRFRIFFYTDHPKNHFLVWSVSDQTHVIGLELAGLWRARRARSSEKFGWWLKKSEIISSNWGSKNSFRKKCFLPKKLQKTWFLSKKFRKQWAQASSFELEDCLMALNFSFKSLKMIR